jgi:hypothetical protein
MIESDAYPVAGTPQRISTTGSIVASSSDTNSPPRTPSHQTTHNDMISPSHYFTPKTPGSVMTGNYTTHPIYHYNNHSTNTPTSYKNTFSPNTNHSEYHVGSSRKVSCNIIYTLMIVFYTC